MQLKPDTLDLNLEIMQLLKDGRRIEAIKRVREATGLGLATAKEAVERLEAGASSLDVPLPAGSGSNPAARLDEALPRLRPEIIALMQRHQSIEAIKLVRSSIPDLGLREAKDTVEQIAREEGLLAPTVGAKSGCSAVLILLAMVLVPWSARDQSRPYPAQDPQSIIRTESPAPSINGPRVVGASPGKPFLFLIPATGQAPLTFAAQNLPAGLALDPATGIISGALAAEATTVARLTVTGPAGRASRNLTIVGKPNEIALTPPMGWNSWYVWGLSITDAQMRAAADSLVTTGLAAHGYQYVNIDDGWEKGQAVRGFTVFGPMWKEGLRGNGRDPGGEILTNDKFPDMTALGDYIHDRGLKFGIYSSPGPWTCGGYQGSEGHWRQDAETYAKWGVDFFKHDWCSYGVSSNGLNPRNLPWMSRGFFQKPYLEMSAFVRATSRDMVFSLCQYGMRDVWEWGEAVGGNMWRTHGDLQDNWKRISTIGFDQGRMAPYARPGHWNDPDMIMVGMLGMGPKLHPTGMNPDEQITQFSLWSLVAAPLLISCDLTRIDAFTLALLSNDEVIAVDQDPLGKAATPRTKDGQVEVWARPLVDGTMAAGLFNRGEKTAVVTATWSAIGVTGRQPVRDLWRGKDLGEFSDGFSAEVPPHGTVLIKVGRPAELVPGINIKH